MSRSTWLVLWLFSVVVAAIFGWYSGISNAAHVAQSSAHLVMWLLLFAIVAVAASVAYFGFKLRHHDRTPSEPTPH